MSTTLERVMKAIAEQLGTHPGNVKPDSNLFTDLGADSLDQVEICMAVEDEFEVEIPDDEAEAIDTPQGYVDWIKRYTRQG